MTKNDWSNLEVYFSVDIEADGPIPGDHSMLSFGIVPIFMGEIVDDGIEVNLDLLEGATPDPDTMAWWSKQGDMYARTRQNTLAPTLAMTKANSYINEWSREQFGAYPVLVGYPLFFDQLFFYWYQMKFAKKSPTSFSGVDIKTAAWMKLGGEYRGVSKRRMPQDWHSKRPHTHGALDDALEQADLFINMMESA